MTFEQILVMYLYQHRKVSLQGFGTIELTNPVPDTDMIRKERNLPVEGVVLHYQPRVQTDEAFIEYFAQQKGKIKPLAASDIEMHLLLVKQMVNIGNPYDIPGVGQIHKQNNGDLLLEPGKYIVPPAEGSGRPTYVREREQQGPELPRITDEGDMPRRTRQFNLKPLMMTLGVLALLGAAAWAAWTFWLSPGAQASGNNNNSAGTVAPVDTTAQSAAQETALSDSANLLQAPADSLRLDSNTVVTWKAYFRQFNDLAKAQEKLKMYQGYQIPVQLETRDSIEYEIFVPLQSSVADTARKADSLRKFFARPVRLEILDSRAQ